MLDYGYNFMNTKIFIDNESTIYIVKNLVFHSKTKNIKIRHHFIRDSYEKRLIQVIKIHTDHNVTDLLTKAFNVSRFHYLVATAKDRIEINTGNSSVNAAGHYLVLIAENADFAEIVDFLNANPIMYALTARKEFFRESNTTFETMLIQHQAEVGVDETVYKEREDRVERVATTAASIDAKQDMKRVKWLEKKRMSRTLKLKRKLFKVKIESSAEKSLGDQEDASNQRRNDQDEGISFVQDAKIQGRYGHDTKINTASTSITTISINITIVEPITTVSAPITIVGVSVSIAEPKNSSETATKPTRRVIMREASENTIRPTLPPQQKLDPKDKGKGKMVEPEKPLKKKVQIELDEKVARNLEAELEEEERLARQKKMPT
uniref:Putative ribonuclease H-like domain-containing protein n=1 Tax=Tanacetum cinerariifolium TaxID=118510 RepID=A0A6L2JMX4_TANCI|nr:putative ribonuclease H-like domain-containing protein [Tanacetum cinerariifolium]